MAPIFLRLNTVRARLGGHPAFPDGVFDNKDGRLTIPTEDDAGQIVPVVKWSVASLEEMSLSELLGDFDVRLFVDRNPEVGTNILESPEDFTEFSAVADTSGSGALDWVLSDSTIVSDDSGSTHVSQNIQPLSWLTSGTEDGSLAPWGAEPVFPGEYTVSLAVYEKGSTDIIGVTTAVFDIHDATA